MGNSLWAVPLCSFRGFGIFQATFFGWGGAFCWDAGQNVHDVQMILSADRFFVGGIFTFHDVLPAVMLRCFLMSFTSRLQMSQQKSGMSSCQFHKS